MNPLRLAAGGARAAVSAALVASLAACSGGGGGGSSSGGTVPAPAQQFTSVVETNEQARSADSLVQTLGVNTHFVNAAPYYSNMPAIDSLMEQLGVRHVRDSAYTLNSNYVICQNARTLAGAGIRSTFIVSVGFTAADIDGWSACAGPGLGAYEGENEYDINTNTTDGTWVGRLKAAQHLLYATVKGDSATAAIPVYAPTLTSTEANTAVGDISSSLDDGNVHQGFAGFNPGTTGFGAGGYGSIAYNLDRERINAGAKPEVVTELAYPTAPLVNDVTPAVQAKYVPRAMLLEFEAGTLETDYYEMVDQPLPGASSQFENSGLVDQNLAPKPAFLTLRDMTQLLAEPGASFSPGTLSYTLANVPVTTGVALQHALLQKSNGDYYLALWLEGQGYDPNKLVDTPLAPATITVQLSAVPSAVTYYAQAADYSLAPSSIAPSRSFTVSVSDSVSYLKLSH